MRRLFFGALWLVVFALAGAAIILPAAALALHHKLAFNRQLARLGGELGADVFVFALCFGLLPGARLRRGAARPFGPWQAAQVILGFGATLIAGGLAIYNMLFVEDLALAAAHAGPRVDFSAHAVLATTALAGELAAALWVCWYLRQLGMARVTDGGAGGIGWRTASRNAYRVAIVTAFLIIVAVAILYHFVPPNLTALKALPDAELLSGPGWMLAPVLLLYFVIAPVLEEFVFRGVAFAAIASRFGAFWAGVVTTALFMLLHAPEKIHYPAGFLDVGLMAAASCWLRVRFRSIRPGIVLHIVYNTGLMFVVASTS